MDFVIVEVAPPPDVDFLFEPTLWLQPVRPRATDNSGNGAGRVRPVGDGSSSRVRRQG